MYDYFRVGFSNEDNKLWIKLYCRKGSFIGIDDENRKINMYIVNMLFTKLTDGFELAISRYLQEIIIGNCWQLKNCRLEQPANS